MERLLISVLLLLPFLVEAQQLDPPQSEIENSILLKADAEALWDQIKRFGGLEKYNPETIHSCIVTGAGIGATRKLTLADGSIVIEELTAIDETSKTITYKMIRTPMPLQNYIGRLGLEKLEKGYVRVSFASTFLAGETHRIQLLTTLDTFQKIQLLNIHQK